MAMSLDSMLQGPSSAKAKSIAVAPTPAGAKSAAKSAAVAPVSSKSAAIPPKPVAALAAPQTPAQPPLEAEPASAPTESECALLQGQITGMNDPSLETANCSLVTFIAGQPAEGCECRLLRTQATGGRCPYDCQTTGGVACVTDEAKRFGITGLTVSKPMMVPAAPGSNKEREAVLCMYWQWKDRAPMDPEAQMMTRAKVMADLRVRHMVEVADEEASRASDVDYQVMMAATPAPFTIGPAVMTPGKATGFLQINQQKNNLTHHDSSQEGNRYQIYSTQSKFLGQIEVFEKNMGSGKYLRTFVTNAVAQSEATFNCQGVDENKHGKNCKLDTAPSPLETAYLRNSLLPPMSFVGSMSWFGGKFGPETHIAVLGFGAGTIPMFVRSHMQKTHVSAVDIDPTVYDVAFNYFGVPLPIPHQHFSAMRDNPDKVINGRCTHDQTLCVEVQDGMGWLKAMPQNSIDLLIIDCFGGNAEAPDWLHPDKSLRELVQEAKRTSRVVLVNEASGIKDAVEGDVKYWHDGGFPRVLTYGFDDGELQQVRAALCPGQECGKWNKFLLAISDSALDNQQALNKAVALDGQLHMDTRTKVYEIFMANK